MQFKHQQIYSTALGLIMKVVINCFETIAFVADFEIALRNTFIDEFSVAIELGCNFHWKRTETERLRSNHVPYHLIKQLMGQQKEDGLIDLLIVLKYDEISKGIVYIRSKMDETG